MAKVRCTWVDRPTLNGFEVGMVFEAEKVSEGFFTLTSLVWANGNPPRKWLPTLPARFL